MKKITFLPILKIRSKESFVLYFTMLVIGACGLAYEYTFCKIASDLLGNSVQQWAVIIGLMMFFMGLGSDVQKYVSDINLFDKFIAAEVCLGLAGGFGPVLLLFIFGVMPEHYVFFQYFFIAIIGLLIGFEIPIITRINQQYTSELKVNLGGILKMDYIGALCGSLIWIFVLPKFFILTETAFILGLLNTGAACITFLYFRNLVGNKQAIGWFCAAGVMLLAAGFFTAKDFSSYSEQYLYRDKIVLSATSQYQHIVITTPRSGDIACYINGHLQFNGFDEHVYHENLVHPAFAIAPVIKKILVLGGGDGLALREILKYPEVESVTLCDIDPEMTRLAADNPYFCSLNHNSLNNSRVKTIRNHTLVDCGLEIITVPNQVKPYYGKPGKVAEVNIVNLDAAGFVEQITGTYDLIIIDFPDPNAPGISKLYSKRFYVNIEKKLAANGIVVQQATSPVMAREAFLCIGRTMKASGLTVVPYHDNVPSFGEWGWWIGGRSFMLSEKKIKQKLTSISQIHVDTKYLTPALVRASLEFGKNQLTTSNTDINTIMSNRVYEYYLKGWRQNF